MKTRGQKLGRIVLGLISLVFITGTAWKAIAQKTEAPTLLGLVPEIEGWNLSEEPRSFFPGNLYEHIDGAAENYISFDFKELIVAQFQKVGTEMSVTLEIYDMGNGTNSFGIFSIERFPDNKVVDVGTLGYTEGEVLNFIAGEDYVKITCFEAGEETAAVLDMFARKVAGKEGKKSALPPLLSVFPREGMIVNSEKYFLRNVMGFEFLGNGYMASYELDGNEFDGFIIETGKSGEPAALLKKLLDFYAKTGQPAEEVPLGHHVRNKYGQNLYVGVSGAFLFGVSRLPDGAGMIGNRYLKTLEESLKGRS